MPTPPQKFLSDYDYAALAAEFASLSFREVHAAKLLKTYYSHPDSLSLPDLRLGKSVEEHIQKNIPLFQSTLRLKQQSEDGTAKLLLDLAQGGAVETVLMPAYDPARAAGCVSSQIGCAMGCDFCASTKNGLIRSLSAGEIVEQFLQLKIIAKSLGRRVSTLVYMGMGEPLLNLDAVIASIAQLTDRRLGELGAGHICVSTVGIVPGIHKLAESGLGVSLALSLHAPDDETRAKLIPMNRRYPVADIMQAAKDYHAKTGRIVNIEYCLLNEINDTPEHAQKLAALMKDFRAHVNLIPYNAIGPGISGTVYQKPPRARMNVFLETLMSHKIAAHFRRERGTGIDAACGQLANRTSKTITPKTHSLPNPTSDK